MKTLLQTAVAYKLALFIGLLFSINALTTSCAAALTGVKWSALDPTQHFCIIMLIVANWTGAMLAFCNRSLQRVEQGQFPLPTGDTTFLAKTTTTTEIKDSHSPPLQKAE